jgi:RNA polymerase sigma factor (sigma-70 family)
MDLARALEHLSARQRRLLWLRYGRDLAYCDVAQRVGVSPAAARVAVHRSREAIRQALALL